MIARILSGIIGLFMLYTCVGWLVNPANAAAGLAMPLLEGMGGNTQIGDFTSFFFTAGVFACIGHFFLILSLKYADASKLAPLGYTEIITNILISYYFFHELPDNWTYLGLFIIVLSGLYISRREYLLTRSN